MSLKIRHLTYSVGKRTLIDDLSLDLEPKKFYGLLAPNGAGKSTLLKLINRLLIPAKGEIFFEDKRLQTLSRIELSRLFSLVPQQPRFTFNFTVYEMVAMGCYAKQEGERIKEERIKRALEIADGWQLRHRFLDELSGGERQRIYIARSLASEASILLLDEPFTYLDLRHQFELMRLILKLKEDGKTVIMALHDFRMAEELCEEVILLKNGKLESKGKTQEVIQSPCFEELFGVRRLSPQEYCLRS